MRKKWTWGRERASIANWDLTVRFFRKEQIAGVVAYLMEEELNYEFTVEYAMGDGTTPPTHTLTIHNMSWANNLQRVAEILNEWDYDFDGPA